MQRPLFFLLVLCFLVAAAVVGYGQWANPTPPPATATATPTSQPAAVPTSTPVVLTTDRIALAPFTIALPTPWSVLRPANGAWAGRLKAVAVNHPNLAHYLTTLATASAVEQTLALAWLPTPTIDLTLVAAVAPAEGVTLQSYLAAAKEELEQSRLVVGSGLTVKSAAIRYDLHQAQIPIATLHYTLPGDQTAEQSGAAITGYQAIMLDKTGAYLLLLTFVTRDSKPEAALALIDSIVAKVQEE